MVNEKDAWPHPFIAGADIYIPAENRLKAHITPEEWLQYLDRVGDHGEFYHTLKMQVEAEAKTLDREEVVKALRGWFSSYDRNTHGGFERHFTVDEIINIAADAVMSITPPSP